MGHKIIQRDPLEQFSMTNDFVPNRQHLLMSKSIFIVSVSRGHIDKDSLLGQTLVRFLEALFSTRPLPWHSTSLACCPQF